jgi:hypothetical protein
MNVRFVSGLLQLSKQILGNQSQDAYVSSAFRWRRYLPAHNVCAPRFLFGSMDSMASKRNRFYQGGYLNLIPVCRLNSFQSS